MTRTPDFTPARDRNFTPARPDPSLPPLRVNLSSDTQTRPTAAMKAAMMAAEVGDEQHGDDPTVHALCDRMAALLGKEAAVFVPSGTMCNQIALLTWCERGDEVLAHETAHIITSEGGAPGALAGVMVHGLKGARGQFDADDVEDAIRGRSRYDPPQSLLAVEQTSNKGGGSVWPVSRLEAVTARAHAHGLAVHMDGARLMNAVVATGVPADVMVAGCDSVWLDFTNGLGAPLGAVLCGSASFIGRAWRWKQRIGGSMRQGGLNAAGCLYALDHHVACLADDHARARRLAGGLSQMPGIVVEAPDTNLVFFDVSGTGLDGEIFEQRARLHGVAVSVAGRHRVRVCTHLDVDDAGIATALDVFRTILGEA